MVPMIAAAALAAQPTLPDYGARVAWEQVLDDQHGRIEIDPASIRRAGDVARFHVRMTNKEGRINAPFSVAMMAIVIDCRARTSGIEAGRAYDGDGALVRSRAVEADAVEMAAFETGSAEDFYHRRVCR